MSEKLRRICAKWRKQIESVFCAALLCKKHFSAGGVCDRRECMERPQRLCRKAPQGFSDRLSPCPTGRGLSCIYTGASWADSFLISRNTAV